MLLLPEGVIECSIRTASSNDRERQLLLFIYPLVAELRRSGVATNREGSAEDGRSLREGKSLEALVLP